MNTKVIPYVLVFIALGAMCLWSLIWGLVLTALVGFIWLANWFGQKQYAQWVKKYGKEQALKISLKQVEIGMPREVVELIWGAAANIKRATTAAGVTMRCDHGLIQESGASHYRYYAVYKNDILTEFGDK